MSDGYGKTVKINYSSTGLNTIIKQQRVYNAELGKTGIMTTKLDAQGKVLSATWKEQTGMLSGTVKQLIGMAAVTVIAHKAMAKFQELIGEGIKNFREFQTRIAEINTILGDQEEQIPRLSVGIEVLAKRYGQATSDLAKGMYDILSAAFSAKDAMYLLEVATKASIAGLSDVRTSVDIFTTVLNAYGMSAYRAGEISDILFQSVIRGKFQFKDLESALGYVVPIAAQAGIEFKELMAALSTTTRHGLHLDMTARGLALAMQNISNPTKAAADAAAELGIGMNDISLHVLGLEGWFKQLNKVVKEQGANISDLIKNMRSLRVAMVLAGDEGIQGLIDDMALLDVAAGKTEEALAKIAETQQFQLNRVQQELEVIERDYGDWWGGVELSWKKAVVAVSDYLDKFPGSGTRRAALKKEIMEGITVPTLTGDTRKDAKAYKDVVSIMNDLSNEMTKISQETDIGRIEYQAYEEIIANLYETLNKLAPAYAELTAESNRYANALLDEKAYLIKISSALKDYRDDLEDSQKELKILYAEKEYEDLSHQIQMGLKLEGYQYKNLSKELQNAVDYVREFDDAQEQNRINMEKYNIAIRENNLAIMKLQLEGMKRRHGLRRSEERQIKQLQIANLEERIAAEENNQALTVSDYDTYLEKKKLIDDTLLAEKERVYQLKYSYDEDIKNLEDYIETIKGNINEYLDYLKTTIQRIKQYQSSLGSATFNQLFAGQFEPEERTNAFLSAIRNRLGFGTAYGGLQHGSYFVPQTRPYLLHKGETVSPAGRKSGNVIVRVDPITVNAVLTDNMSLQQFGNRVGQVLAAGIVKGVTSEFEIG